MWRAYGRKTVDRHGPRHYGSPILGTFRYIRQFLENAKHLNVEWLLEVRLLVAGLLTILLAYVQDGMRIFDIFKNPKDFGKLLIFGILGIALAQYTYFRAIAISGVGVATVLQYVAPTMLIIYLFI